MRPHAMENFRLRLTFKPAPSVNQHTAVSNSENHLPLAASERELHRIQRHNKRMTTTGRSGNKAAKTKRNAAAPVPYDIGAAR